jgi:hypothetical protein
MQMYTLKVLQVGLGAAALAAFVIAGIAADDAAAAGVAPIGQPSTGTFRAFNYSGMNSAKPGFGAQPGVAAAPAAASSVQPVPNGAGWSRAGHGGLPGVGS